MTRLPAPRPAGPSPTTRRSSSPTRPQGALEDGGVDSRVVSVLAQVAGDHDLGVTGFPSVFGEQGQVPARTLVLDSIDGQPVDSPEGQALAAEIADQVGAYEPDSVDIDGDQLVVRFGLADSADLLPAPAGT